MSSLQTLQNMKNLLDYVQSQAIHFNAKRLWYGIYFPYKSTIHNINMSFKNTAGFALLSKHLQSIAVFQRGPVNN